MQTFPLALILMSIPFMTSMGITPGPNNILVASSGVNFGFRATIPHILGITIGYPLMLFIVGVGLAKIFIAVPLIHTILKYISIMYLLYLPHHAGVRDGRSAPPTQAVKLSAGRRFSMGEWQSMGDLGSVSCWTFFGAFMRQYLQTEVRRRWFNYAMAALLVLSNLPVLWE